MQRPLRNFNCPHNNPIEGTLAARSAIATTTVIPPTLLAEVVELMGNARRKAARSAHSIITATDWLDRIQYCSV